MGGGAHKAGAVYFEFFAKTAGLRTSLSQIKADFNTLKRSAQVASAGIALAFKSAFQSQMEFHSALRRLGVVISASQKDIDGLSQTALEWSKTSGYSATQVLKAFLRVGQAGVTARKDVENLTRASIFLGHAAKISAEDAAEDLTGIMLGYRLQSEEMQRVADDLATIFTATKTDLVDLLEGIKFAGPWAREAGLSVQELAIQLGLLGNNMLRSGLAGRNWRAMIISLKVPTEQTKAILKDLGIDFTEIRPILDKYGVDFSEAADAPSKLMEKLAELKEVATPEEMGKVFTRIASSAALILSQSLTEYNKLMALVKEGRNTAQELTQEALKTTKGQWEILKNSIESVGTAFLEKFNPALEESLDKLRAYAGAIGIVILKHPDLILDIGKLTVGFIGLTALFAILNPLLAAAHLGILIVAGAAHLLVAGVLVPLLKGFGKLVKWGAKGALFALAFAPVTTAILALVAVLTTLAYFNWDTITAGFDTMMAGVDKIVEKIKGFGEAVDKYFTPAAAALIGKKPLPLGPALDFGGEAPIGGKPVNGALALSSENVPVTRLSQSETEAAMASLEKKLKKAPTGKAPEIDERGLLTKALDFVGDLLEKATAKAGGFISAHLETSELSKYAKLLPQSLQDIIRELTEALRVEEEKIKDGFKPSEEEPKPDLTFTESVGVFEIDTRTILDKLREAAVKIGKSFVDPELGVGGSINKGFLSAIQGAGVPLSLEDLADQLLSETELMQEFGENVQNVIGALSDLIDALAEGIASVFGGGEKTSQVIGGGIGGALTGAGTGFYLSGGNPYGAAVGAIAGAALGTAGSIIALGKAASEEAKRLREEKAEKIREAWLVVASDIGEIFTRLLDIISPKGMLAVAEAKNTALAARSRLEEAMAKQAIMEREYGRTFSFEETARSHASYIIAARQQTARAAAASRAADLLADKAQGGADKFAKTIDVLIDVLEPEQLKSLKAQLESTLDGYNLELALFRAGLHNITPEMAASIRQQVSLIESALSKFVDVIGDAVKKADQVLTELFDQLIKAVISVVSPRPIQRSDSDRALQPPKELIAGKVSFSTWTSGGITDALLSIENLGNASEETRTRLLGMAESQLSDYILLRDLKAAGYDVTAQSLRELDAIVEILTGTVTDLEGAMGLAVKAVLDKSGAEAIDEFIERTFGPEGPGVGAVLPGIASLDQILDTDEMKDFNEQIQTQLRDMQITRALLPVDATQAQVDALDQQITVYEALVEQLNAMGYAIDETTEKLGDFNVPSGYKVNLARWLAISTDSAEAGQASADAAAAAAAAADAAAAAAGASTTISAVDAAYAIFAETLATVGTTVGTTLGTIFRDLGTVLITPISNIALGATLIMQDLSNARTALSDSAGPLSELASSATYARDELSTLGVIIGGTGGVNQTFLKLLKILKGTTGSTTASNASPVSGNN